LSALVLHPATPRKNTDAQTAPQKIFLRDGFI
jgi:hypothetical protein